MKRDILPRGALAFEWRDQLSRQAAARPPFDASWLIARERQASSARPFQNAIDVVHGAPI
jgi:hypothetical protein